MVELALAAIVTVEECTSESLGSGVVASEKVMFAMLVTGVVIVEKVTFTVLIVKVFMSELLNGKKIVCPDPDSGNFVSERTAPE